MKFVLSAVIAQQRIIITRDGTVGQDERSTDAIVDAAALTNTAVFSSCFVARDGTVGQGELTEIFDSTPAKRCCIA